MFLLNEQQTTDAYSKSAHGFYTKMMFGRQQQQQNPKQIFIADKITQYLLLIFAHLYVATIKIMYCETALESLHAIRCAARIAPNRK